MIRRIAVSLALVVFAACLIAGGFAADNPFSTAIGRALVAMAGTLVIGLVLGAMASRMMDEHLRQAAAKPKPPAGSGGKDR